MSVVHPRLTTLPAENIASQPDRIETDLVPPTIEGWKIIIPGVVLILLTALWTYMRLWSARRNGRGILIEDWLSLCATALFYGVVATDFAMVLAGGMGHHAEQLQDWHVVWLLKAAYARQFLYTISLGLIKLSVILMFIRVFFARRLKPIPVATIILTIAWVALTLLLEMLLCQPISTNWDPREMTRAGRCGDRIAAFVSMGIVDIINKLMILMLPVPTLLEVGVQRHYKIVTTCMFVIGILSMAFGIIRVYTAFHIDFSDVSYTMVQTTIYGTGEVGVAAVVSNSAHLRPVFDWLLGRFWIPDNSTWQESNGEAVLSPLSLRRSTKSSGFTQMKDESQQELELGNMGAHRAKRNTVVTVGKRPSCDHSDDSSIRRIVVTSETIVSRDNGAL
ncbi:hypothetical protein GGS23DRAFT_111062 [Durotheca rogersii]|uniref:uncharacterized protein n=1 Tax=Durotheca rogersii TaxID=419775 RepID=UPI00221ED3B0|nr:uncharacterized protein GGS23DRAFT_111062 [Durotheca rogersii]KAI5862203.1 hypothetical protein GGS23DRAFT_111062 [Durotheca rogersii]